MSVVKRAAARIKAWRESPARFIVENFGVEPDPWQVRALDAFRDPARQRIAMQACAGPGKSAVLAWCGWNFLACYGARDEHPKGAALSVTRDNLRDNLWPELAKWQERSEFLRAAFTWTGERIYANDHPETWFLSARSFPKTANAEEQGRTLSGLHSQYILYLIDESGDINPAVLRSAEQGLGSTRFGKILQAGNPTSHDGMLYAAATALRHQWELIRITGDPDDSERSPRIDIDWAREQIAAYGRDNPWVMAYILGLFPPSSINTLLGPDEVEAAIARHIPETAYHHAQRRLGVDVARFGDDRTVVFPRQGLWAGDPVVMRGATTDQIAARIVLARSRWESEMELVDGSGGYGGGVVDQLRLAGRAPIEVSASGRAADPRYYNRRAEMWWRMAEWVKRGSLPDAPEIVRELTAPTYTLRDGKFLLEAKDQIKKRLGFSPDLADALAHTFALPDMPASGADPLGKVFGGRKLAVESDPYRDEAFQ